MKLWAGPFLNSHDTNEFFFFVSSLFFHLPIPFLFLWSSLITRLKSLPTRPRPILSLSVSLSVSLSLFKPCRWFYRGVLNRAVVSAVSHPTNTSTNQKQHHLHQSKQRAPNSNCGHYCYYYHHHHHHHHHQPTNQSNDTKKKNKPHPPKKKTKHSRRCRRRCRRRC